MTNCPNCAAVITGPKCEYCGTRFDHGAQDMYKPLVEFELLKAKTIVLKSLISTQDLYLEAIKEMRRY